MPSAVSLEDFKYNHLILTSRQNLNWPQGNLNSFLKNAPLACGLQDISSPDSKSSFYGKEDSFLPLTSTFTELYCSSK